MTTDARLLQLLAPYRGRLLAAVACAALAAVGMGGYAWLAGPAVRLLIQGGSLGASGMLQELLPAAFLEALSRFVFGALPALLVGAAAIKAAASAGFNALLPGSVAAAAADLRRLLYERLLRADPGFYRERSMGELVSRMTADVSSAESAATQVVATLVRDVTQAVALLVVCAFIDIRLVIAAAVVVPGTLVPVRRFAAKLRAIGREQLAAQAAVARRAEQMLQGHRIVSAYNGQAFETRRFGKASLRLLETMRTSLRLRAAYSPTMEGLGVVAMALAIAYAGRAVVAGRLPPEAVISFAAAALMLYQPLKALGNLGQQLAQLRAAADRAFEILDAPDAIGDAPGARPVPPPREVRLEGVSVRYGDREVIHDLDLTFRAGETVALVGESGAGKSTIAQLLLRFVEPSSGSVRFDGVDAREIALASLRSHVGYVPQETVVFADTARANITCGAALSDEVVRRAAREANAHVWIERLPGGYDAVLGERGSNLSGGERQRLGVARALARGARVLVLDEATSALDAENDALLQEAFARALGGERIGVIISHRLASLRGVDRVVVLDGGRVVEDGRPDDLLRAGGAFSRLWQLQAA
ncbi:ABC transporter ATP-binding protein [Vulgatibacter sp.]|uniref:ABC transporter ATP-binding protein n=1 Tax=Vulgatibacter sp. TaxID=1971226 RepID=UPI0035657A2D